LLRPHSLDPNPDCSWIILAKLLASALSLCVVKIDLKIALHGMGLRRLNVIFQVKYSDAGFG
jgi:hypothetical protein